MRFAINHISAPKLPLAEFFAMCQRLGVSEVEIRNDIPDVLGTMTPHAVRDEARAQGITILSINALYPFNLWSGDLPDRAQRMADYAAECGAQALVMCPLNEDKKVAHSSVVAALGLGMQPSFATLIFAHYGRHHLHFSNLSGLGARAEKLSARAQRVYRKTEAEMDAIVFAGRIGGLVPHSRLSRSIRLPLSQLIVS